MAIIAMVFGSVMFLILVVELNIWDHNKRKKMTTNERKKEDDDILDEMQIW